MPAVCLHQFSIAVRAPGMRELGVRGRHLKGIPPIPALRSLQTGRLP